MPSQKVPGVEQLESPHSFSDTVAKLENILQAKGLQLFAKIDFSGDAARNGISMITAASADRAGATAHPTEPVAR